MSTAPAVSPEVDAMWDAVLALRVGDTFTVRGRSYSLSDYRGAGGCDAKGEYADLMVFKAGGGERLIRVRPAFPPVRR